MQLSDKVVQEFKEIFKKLVVRYPEYFERMKEWLK